MLARPRGHRRLGLRSWILAGMMLVGVAASAQEAPALAPILTLDQDRLFLESDFGKAVLARERADTAALEQENRRIEAELVAEEQELTDLRATLSAEEFSARAEAFDAKVERIRDEQDAKARRLTERRDADRKAFLEVAVPVLGALLGDRGATAILDKNMVILSLSAVDVTDEAIARVNAALAKPQAPAP
ncbi:MAG: OmpH family outer membrane protein [Tabrizicola sp.]